MMYSFSTFTKKTAIEVQSDAWSAGNHEASIFSTDCLGDELSNLEGLPPLRCTQTPRATCKSSVASGGGAGEFTVDFEVEVDTSERGGWRQDALDSWTMTKAVIGRNCTPTPKATSAEDMQQLQPLDQGSSTAAKQLEQLLQLVCEFLPALQPAINLFLQGADTSGGRVGPSSPIPALAIPHGMVQTGTHRGSSPSRKATCSLLIGSPGSHLSSDLLAQSTSGALPAVAESTLAQCLHAQRASNASSTAPLSAAAGTYFDSVLDAVRKELAILTAAHHWAAPPACTTAASQDEVAQHESEGAAAMHGCHASTQQGEEQDTSPLLAALEADPWEGHDTEGEPYLSTFSIADLTANTTSPTAVWAAQPQQVQVQGQNVHQVPSRPATPDRAQRAALTASNASSHASHVSHAPHASCASRLAPAGLAWGAGDPWEATLGRNNDGGMPMAGAAAGCPPRGPDSCVAGCAAVAAATATAAGSAGMLAGEDRLARLGAEVDRLQDMLVMLATLVQKELGVSVHGLNYALPSDGIQRWGVMGVGSEGGGPILQHSPAPTCMFNAPGVGGVHDFEAPTSGFESGEKWMGSLLHSGPPHPPQPTAPPPPVTAPASTEQELPLSSLAHDSEPCALRDAIGERSAPQGGAAWECEAAWACESERGAGDLHLLCHGRGSLPVPTSQCGNAGGESEGVGDGGGEATLEEQTCVGSPTCASLPACTATAEQAQVLAQGQAYCIITAPRSLSGLISEGMVGMGFVKVEGVSQGGAPTPATMSFCLGAQSGAEGQLGVMMMPTRRTTDISSAGSDTFLLHLPPHHAHDHRRQYTTPLPPPPLPPHGGRTSGSLGGRPPLPISGLGSAGGAEGGAHPMVAVGGGMDGMVPNALARTVSIQLPPAVPGGPFDHPGYRHHHRYQASLAGSDGTSGAASEVVHKVWVRAASGSTFPSLGGHSEHYAWGSTGGGSGGGCSGGSSGGGAGAARGGEGVTGRTAGVVSSCGWDELEMRLRRLSLAGSQVVHQAVVAIARSGGGAQGLV